MFAAHCVNLKVTMKYTNNKIIETMKDDMLSCFNQKREDDNKYDPNFSLRDPRNEVALDNDFENTICPRFGSQIDTSFVNLREELELPISPLPNISSKPSSLRDITADVIPDPPISFAQLNAFKGDVSSMLINGIRGMRNSLGVMIL